MRTFLDSNVLVYAFDRRDQAEHERAVGLISHPEAVDFVVSGQVLGEFYNTVTRRLPEPLPHDTAVQLLERFRRLTVVPIDGDLVSRGADNSDRHQMSYWDGLIFAAAQRAGCDRLLTEDLQSAPTIEGIEIVNPFA